MGAAIQSRNGFWIKSKHPYAWSDPSALNESTAKVNCDGREDRTEKSVGAMYEVNKLVSNNVGEATEICNRVNSVTDPEAAKAYLNKPPEMVRKDMNGNLFDARILSVKVNGKTLDRGRLPTSCPSESKINFRETIRDETSVP